MPELIDVISSNFDYDNFFSAKLTAPMTASDTDIFLDTIPTPSEGVLVIDWDVAASREIIFYNSKTASKVTCPSVANGRGFDDTTATTHLNGANVIMAPVRAWFRLAQQLATTSEQGWKPLGYTPNTITDSGNGIYTLVFNSVDLTSFISVGMKVKATPTTAKPTQCADLESSSSQHFNKTSPTGITFTDDFCAGAWIKPESYPSGGNIFGVITRSDASQGWWLALNEYGQVILNGRNAAAANYSRVTSTRGVPLNRWTHIAAQLDMSAFTATSTTSYVMIDGQDVAATVARAGTNPTALVQAGNLAVGSADAGSFFFDGKIAQAFVSSAKITQANINLLKNQGITSADCGTYSIASAYSLSGASGATDINTTNANNLTAQGGATTTTSDSPFGLDDTGTPGTNEWGVVVGKTFSTNTTLVIKTPEGSTLPTLPTSSALSAMYYSTETAPYGFRNPDDNLGYSIMLNNDSTTSTKAVSGLGVGVYVPSGKTVKITFFCSNSANTGANGGVGVAIFSGSTPFTLTNQLGHSQFYETAVPASATRAHEVVAIHTPASSGWIYYTPQLIEIGGVGTATLSAASTRPMFMTVEIV